MMGRRPKNPNAIPRLRQRAQRSGAVCYYYDTGAKPRREIPLGSDYGLAIVRWAELERDRSGQAKAEAVITFRYVAEAYRREVIPTKAPRTQLDNLKELAWLLKFFDAPPAPLAQIKPQHVRQYLRWRTAKVRANREKALFSAVWNWARGQGFTDAENPAQGIKGNTETGRQVYVEDDVFAAVWAVADVPLRDALDLAYLTAQRVSDVYAMDERHLRDGVLHVRQAKTAEKRRIEIRGDLADLLERIRARKAGQVIRCTSLVVAEDGRPLGRDALRYRFDKARRLAGVPKAEFQFRDLRAKAGTDKTESTDIRQAQQQLGHSSVTMTEHYVRNRRGAKVTPTR